MARFLGIDTSNYTTSAAIYDTRTHCVFQQKQLLQVKESSLGLRQSDAVFSHVKQLGDLLCELLERQGSQLDGVGVSIRPRDVQGSYMPCFLVGELVARSVAAAKEIPVYFFSHQAGHIMAALYSAQRLDLINETFVAFHLSGGTTECLLVTPNKEGIFSVQLLAKSMDLKAGQVVDRTGKLLGLPFPAGKELETLALKSEKIYKIHPTFKGKDCCLSGLENQCQKLLAQGEAKEEIAAYCIQYLLAVVERMTKNIKEELGDLPIVYSGGVMSNSMIRQKITEKYGGYFAQPQFSSDNAAGVAVLASVQGKGGTEE